MSRPLRIGLSARILHRIPAELGFRGKTLQYLEQSLAHWIMAHGALAFMVPTVANDATARASVRMRDYVEALDGLVLQGGADVSPLSYGEDPLRPEWGGDRVRDLYELDLFWQFIIEQKPVLGICRGAQLINVAMGGTLYQDLAQTRPGPLRHIDSDLYDELRHRVVFVPHGRLGQLYGSSTEGHVVSIHHQAIKELGSGIRAEAHADDGVVEAIRWEGVSYVFGVQWHPEFHAPDVEGLLDGTPIMEEFLQAARRAADARGERAERLS